MRSKAECWSPKRKSRMPRKSHTIRGTFKEKKAEREKEKKKKKERVARTVTESMRDLRAARRRQQKAIRDAGG